MIHKHNILTKIDKIYKYVQGNMVSQRHLGHRMIL